MPNKAKSCHSNPKNRFKQWLGGWRWRRWRGSNMPNVLDYNRSEKDMACIDTQHKCKCGDLQYHSFCLRRHRNVCRDKNIPMKCGRHRNEIHHIMNMDGANIFEVDDDICLICMDSLDTISIWGRFVRGTCPLWYHNDYLLNYVNTKGSYHRDSCTGQYTRLKCAMCRESPRSTETL